MATDEIATFDDLMGLLERDPESLSRMRWQILDKEFQRLPAEVRSLSQTVQSHTTLLQSIVGSLEGHSRTLDSHSQMLEAQGQTLDSHSQTLDTHSQMLEAQGQTLDSHSQMLEAQGRTLDTHSQMLEAQGQTLDSHSQMLEAQGQTLDSHSQMLEAQGRTLDTHSQMLEAQGQTLDSHSRTLDSHSQMLEAQGRTLDSHSQMLEAQGRTLDTHSQMLEAQSRTLDSHSQTLDSHSQMLEAQGRTLDTHSQMLEAQGRRLDRHEIQLARLIGDEAERRFQQNAAAYFGRMLRRIRVIAKSTLADLIDDAVDDGLLTEEDQRALLALDLVIQGLDRESRQPMRLAVEISASIGERDIMRAADRATRLQKLSGHSTRAVVAGYAISPFYRQLADANDVAVTIITPPDAGEPEDIDEPAAVNDLS